MRTHSILAGLFAGFAFAFAAVSFLSPAGLFMFENPSPFLGTIFGTPELAPLVAFVIVGTVAALFVFAHLSLFYVNLFTGLHAAIRRYCKPHMMHAAIRQYCKPRMMHGVLAKLFKPKICAFLGLVARLAPERYDRRFGLVA